jgi:hypothetical protein
VVIHFERITDSETSATGNSTKDAQFFINKPNAQNAEAVGFSGCTNASVKGTYGSQRSGTTNQVPLNAVGMADFDGEGNVVSQQTISTSGNFSSVTNQIATYNINPDCTGTVNDSNGGMTKVVVVHDGSEILGMSLTPGDNMTLHFERITDSGTSASGNPIDVVQLFVRQQYLDFLNREPDQSGWDFWMNQITSCGSDQQCIDAKRINVSAAFFLSIEFQQTGYLAYRMYKAAYGNLPNAPVPIRFNEFLPDTQEIGHGVIVGQAGWETLLENNKQAFSEEFVNRPRFTSAYPSSITAADFVDALNNNAGNPLSQTERDHLVSDLTSGAKTRAQVLRAVAENQNFSNAEFNRAFVLMQYFGYLRRDPNSGPDTDFSGYNFWLNKLNAFNGDYTKAEMIKAFITSTEYRQRFVP